MNLLSMHGHDATEYSLKYEDNGQMCQAKCDLDTCWWDMIDLTKGTRAHTVIEDTFAYRKNEQ